MITQDVQSWGRTIPSVPSKIIYFRPTSSSSPRSRFLDSSFSIPRVLDSSSPLFLPFGFGRSYGDVCLNNGGTILRTKELNSILKFDSGTGVMLVEAGASLIDVLNVASVKGWYLPVIPGTGHVSIGGAVANDIHGKNHHKRGTFGCHIKSLTLLRSDGIEYECSSYQNSDLFRATIGGLGLTGVIYSVEIQLMRIGSTRIDVKLTSCHTWRELAQELHKQDEHHEYTVAWVDAKRGRGHVIAGNHRTDGLFERHTSRSLPLAKLMRPFLGDLSVDVFNIVKFLTLKKGTKSVVMSASEYFHPLDVIPHWNLMYGQAGFFQYQFVVPFDQGIEAIETIMTIILSYGITPYLCVLKIFSSMPSPGIMSFPQPGYTLAFDIPNRGAKTLAALSLCDEVVINNNGRIYPAKDARMSAAAFHSMFAEQLKAFKPHVDEKFSSSFWRRVNPA